LTALTCDKTTIHPRVQRVSKSWCCAPQKLDRLKRLRADELRQRFDYIAAQVRCGVIVCVVV
jgi:hypothetical protein